MEKSYRYLPIILFCIALFTGYGAKAQDIFNPEKATPVPTKVVGNWAMPDCGNYDEALIITRHFYLKSTQDGSQFWPIEPVLRKRDYWVMNLEGKTYPVQLQADGVLKIGELSGAMPGQWPERWDSLALDNTREYMGCADVPALLPDPLVRVMTRLDRIAKECSLEISGACGRLLFGIVDDDRNGRISLQEMKMAGAILVSFAALIDVHEVSRKFLDKIVYESFRESDRIAGAMMKRKDGLKYEDFHAFLLNTYSPILKNALETIGAQFPAFRTAALMMAPPPAAPLPVSAAAPAAPPLPAAPAGDPLQK